VLTAPWRGFERFLGSRRAAAGLTILVVLLLVGLFAPLIAPHSPEAIEFDRILAPPDRAHPFGSDALGRDVFSRVLYAYRTSLSVAIGSVLLAVLVGVPLGLLAGYFRKWTDTVIMRPLDMLLALPALLLAVALIAVTGPGSLVVLAAIGLIYLPIIARMMRSSVLTVGTEQYIEGARARGVSHTGVMSRHAMPNSLGPVIVQASILMGFAIQIEAALAFLGLGVQPPTPSLGLMLLDGYQVMREAWWADVFPGLAIVLAVLGFMLLGDGLRARLDPRGVTR
jgi:peptide/nickel transport system permease protein